MKIMVLGILLLMIGTTAWASGESFAVVELFASEGCSSCPPADSLLRDLTQQAKVSGKRIFTLDFQVDYWNNLGWKDPFSDESFTKRQYQYADALGSSSVYTPEMIVNGQYGFVGSESEKAQKYINESLSTPPDNNVQLKIKSNDFYKIQISYTVEKLSNDTVINFALLQDGLESQVTAGENQGHLLQHANIVREFKTIPLKQLQGEISFKTSATMEKKSFSIVAFLQNNRSMKILAVDRISL